MYQLPTDSTQAAAVHAADSAGAQQDALPRKKTVWQVIKALPPDATPAQQDSAVQAAFPGKVLTWPEGARTDLPLGTDSAACAALPRLDPFSLPGVEGMPWQLEEVPYRAQGIAGDPLPYRFRTDDYVTSILMLSFFLMAWVIARSWHFLAGSLKDFFHVRERENMFTNRTDTELRGQVFLIFQTCFVLGILFFDYTQERMQEVFNQVSPYKILGMAVGACSLFCALKVALYKFVNSIFFERKPSGEWIEAYHLSVLALGLALLPLALLVVFFDLSFRETEIIFLCILFLTKVLLFYKCFLIFFNYKFGSVHLILYFCALEFLPLLALWRALVFACSYLTIII